MEIPESLERVKRPMDLRYSVNFYLLSFDMKTLRNSLCVYSWGTTLTLVTYSFSPDNYFVFLISKNEYIFQWEIEKFKER